MTDFNGIDVVYTYNNNNLLTGEEYYSGAALINRTAYTYDEAGFLKQETDGSIVTQYNIADDGSYTPYRRQITADKK